MVVGGIGVRHLEDAGHSAQHSGAAAAFQILLVLIAGLAEMDLGVDHAGQDVEPPGVEDLGGLGVRERADGGNAPADDADIALGDAIGGGDRAAADQEVETLGICLAHGHLS